MNDELTGSNEQLARANADLEAFSYTVAHDLRSPIRQIAGFSKILLEEYAPQMPAEARTYLDRVVQGAQRMGTLVDDLLHLAQVGRQPLTLQLTALNSVVAAAWTDCNRNVRRAASSGILGSLGNAMCDGGLMAQVFVNLLSNALKYSAGRNPTVIEVEQTHLNGEQVIFVRDNGVGFDMRYAGKLFAVFERLHTVAQFEGTGIGLATVERIIRRHGGRIWAEAEPTAAPPSSSRFARLRTSALGTVLCHRNAAMTTEIVLVETEIDVLLIEDNPADAELTVHELRRRRFANRIHVIGDGAEALDFIFCRGNYHGRSFSAPPKVILLDMRLPKVDGLEILKAIKADPRTRATPVVVMTSSSEQKDLIESYQLGVNAFIQKPVDFDDFRRVIERVGMFWLAVNQAPSRDVPRSSPAAGGLTLLTSMPAALGLHGDSSCRAPSMRPVMRPVPSPSSVAFCPPPVLLSSSCPR